MISEAEKTNIIPYFYFVENIIKMNLKIVLKNLIITLVILQGVCSEHYEFSSSISNYQKLNIEGSYSYLASICEGEFFMTNLQFIH